MGKRLDLRGRQFGELVVISRGPQDRHKRYMWLCRCSCGNEKLVHGRHLTSGATRTCGCKTGLVLPKPYLGKTGAQHPKWKGGRYLRRDGYIMVYVGPGRYEMEHRLVMRDSLFPGAVVHHKNHDKTDNRPGNLQAMSRSAHAKEHALGVSTGSGRRKLKARWYIERLIARETRHD